MRGSLRGHSRSGSWVRNGGRVRPRRGHFRFLEATRNFVSATVARCAASPFTSQPLGEGNMAGFLSRGPFFFLSLSLLLSPLASEADKLLYPGPSFVEEGGPLSKFILKHGIGVLSLSVSGVMVNPEGRRDRCMAQQAWKIRPHWKMSFGLSVWSEILLLWQWRRFSGNPPNPESSHMRASCLMTYGPCYE